MKAADRIAARAATPSRRKRIAAFVEEQRAAEEVPGPVSTAVREAIAASGLSLREIARRSAVSHGQLGRFLRRERTLTLEALDRLAPVLKLKVSSRARKREE